MLMYNLSCEVTTEPLEELLLLLELPLLELELELLLLELPLLELLLELLELLPLELPARPPAGERGAGAL